MTPRKRDGERRGDGKDDEHDRGLLDYETRLRSMTPKQRVLLARIRKSGGCHVKGPELRMARTLEALGFAKVTRAFPTMWVEPVKIRTP